jgi:succinyl-CoA synthetase beta subunit
VVEKLDIVQKFYGGIRYDTVAKEPIAIFSAQGGVDIEESDFVPILEALF